MMQTQVAQTTGRRLLQVDQTLDTWHGYHWEAQWRIRQATQMSPQLRQLMVQSGRLFQTVEGQCSHGERI